MLLTIALIVIVAFAVFHWLFIGGGNPLFGIRGGLKGAWYFITGLSAVVTVTLLIKLIWWGFVILSLDILTPPYGFDIETLFAIPLATWFKGLFELSTAWAFGIAYVLIFSTALAILLLHWFVVRHYLKAL